MKDIFPKGDYTPFGYLKNRYDGGDFWGMSTNQVRSIESCGFGWYSPNKDRVNMASLRVAVTIGDKIFFLPNDFRKSNVELISRYHTSNIMSFNWLYAGISVDIYFLVVQKNALACIVKVKGTNSRVYIHLIGSLRTIGGRYGSDYYEAITSEDHIAMYGAKGPWYVVISNFGKDKVASGIIEDFENLKREMSRHARSMAYNAHHVPQRIGGFMSYEVNQSGIQEVVFVLTREITHEQAYEEASNTIKNVSNVFDELLQEDERFWSSCPKLAEDWPDAWKHSWIYDFETTRMCVFPPMGVFRDSWPTWMISKPRVVLAENTLDMMRLHYADNRLAQKALLTVFKSARMPNIPCMFPNGNFNMVAQDNSICGTSPAWCLPFHQIYLMYLRQLDKNWIAQLYPYMASYLQWWLDNRIDEEGWAVYKCTWEAGEDANPRLDPDQTGDGDITGIVRPVDLQAAIAISAHILTIFAKEIGLGIEEVNKWEKVYDNFSQRTQKMWDNETNTFRDWDKLNDCWTKGKARYSPLSLITLMYEVVKPQQRKAFKNQITQYNSSPTIIWASWTTIVCEAATYIGEYEIGAQIAYSVLKHVYPENDRRTLEPLYPLPGEQREYWPSDLNKFEGNEVYGWGAVTSQILLRQIIGFLEDEDTSKLIFKLVPAIPKQLNHPGKQYKVQDIRYRGIRFDLSYIVVNDGTLRIRLEVDGEKRCRILTQSDELIYELPWAKKFEFKGKNFTLYKVELI